MLDDIADPKMDCFELSFRNILQVVALLILNVIKTIKRKSVNAQLNSIYFFFLQ